MLLANFPKVSLISEFRQKSLGLQIQVLHCVFPKYPHRHPPVVLIFALFPLITRFNAHQHCKPTVSHLSLFCIYIRQSRETSKMSFDYQIRPQISWELQFQDYTCSIWGPTCRIKLSRKKTSNSMIWEIFLTQGMWAMCQDYDPRERFCYHLCPLKAGTYV